MNRHALRRSRISQHELTPTSKGILDIGAKSYFALKFKPPLSSMARLEKMMPSFWFWRERDEDCKAASAAKEAPSALRRAFEKASVEGPPRQKGSFPSSY